MRDSNIELLRLIAMLLVMLVHASFLSIGIPTVIDAHAAPITTLNRFLLEAISIICVNVFIIISGWYGTKWNSNKMSSLVFQAYFYSTIIFIFMAIAFNKKMLNSSDIKHLLLLNSNDYWFIKSYLIFFILSPVLNAFIETVSEKKQRNCIIAFFCFQTIFGWLSIDGASEFEGGYSALFFIGLYLTTRYLRVTWPVLLEKITLKQSITIFVTAVLFQTILAYLLTWKGVLIVGRLFTYTNPIVIIQAFSLVICFSKIHPFHNKAINTLASSCLAVYLFHGNFYILRPIYGKLIANAYIQETSIICLLRISIIIVTFFIGALLIDQVRKLLWKYTFDKL